MFDIFFIWQKVKKLLSRKDVIFIMILLIVYFITRLINLDKFPIFGDEGIYIRWAKTAWHDASWRFISLTDGRQPLQTWGTIPFLKLFPNNALLGGRMFAVATGLVGLIGLFVLCFYLFGKKAAYWSAFFYIFTPYFLFYDRMALMDSGVNAAFIWILFFSILLVKTIRLDVALVFGLIAGLSLLSKSSVKLFIGLSALAPLLTFEQKKKDNVKKIVNFFLLFLLVCFFAIAIYNIQRLSPYMHYIAQKNGTFVRSFSQFLKNPMEGLIYHLQAIPEYIFVESGYILPFIGLFGLYLLFKKDHRLAIYLSIWLIASYLIIAVFSIILYPRYVNFIAMLLIVPATYAVTKVNKVLSRTIIIIYILFICYFNYTILFDFKKIPFPEIDQGQYINGGNSGWGAKEIVDIAREKAKTKPVLILAEGDFGMSGDVLSVFVNQNDRINIKGYWPLNKEALISQQKELANNQVLVVYIYKKSYEPDLPLRLIKRFPKPKGETSMDLFELTP